MPSDRHVCTKDDPWTKEKGERSEHPDAVERDSTLCDCCAYYTCPNCGLKFRQELPQ